MCSLTLAQDEGVLCWPHCRLVIYLQLIQSAISYLQWCVWCMVWVCRQLCYDEVACLLHAVNGQRRRGRRRSGRPTSCSYCGKQFPTPSALTVHVRTHTGYRPFVCSRCSQSFTQLSHLKRHTLRRHATSRPYVCAYCHKAFAAVPLLHSHLQIHGIVTRALSRRAVQYSCDVCGLKMSKKHQLNCHLCGHVDERRFLCSRCGRSFASASSFYRHWQIHVPAAAPLPCPTCSKQFASIQLLRQHQVTHSDARPHLCTTCGRRFKRRADLRCHVRIHSNERPYRCAVCSSAFTQAGSLKHHMLVHADERKHQCAVCSRRFRAADKLRVHALMHTDHRPHTCDQCGWSFRDRSAFRRHTQLHLRRQET